MKDVHHGDQIHLLGYVYRIAIGKSAAPFYYIVVLVQLTIITPWLIKIIKQDGIVCRILWLVTPIYLVYVYVWNYLTGGSPCLYETVFPAWFGFYYMGIQVRCGRKFKCGGYGVIAALLISCIEALVLKTLGFNLSFCTSQIRVGSFLYSVVMIGWLLEKSKSSNKECCLLSKIGDCSYGIFYIHMLVLTLVSKFVAFDNWYVSWIIQFTLTSIISFGIVYAGQKLFKNHKKLLQFIGFV